MGTDIRGLAYNQATCCEGCPDYYTGERGLCDMHLFPHMQFNIGGCAEFEQNQTIAELCPHLLFEVLSVGDRYCAEDSQCQEMHEFRSSIDTIAAISFANVVVIIVGLAVFMSFIATRYCCIRARLCGCCSFQRLKLYETLMTLLADFGLQ